MRTQKIFIGSNRDQSVSLLSHMANRHGLIAGATGTGKTVTLQTLAEGFSKIGVPVFMADVKGDLSGLVKPGNQAEKIQQRVTELGISQFYHRPYPSIFGICSIKKAILSAPPSVIWGLIY